jgi:hypothetical protein
MSVKMAFAVTAAFMLAASTMPAQASPRPASLVIGGAGKPQALFVFERTPKPGRIRLTTSLAGVAGSRFAVYVDGGTSPVFQHIFSADDCSFVDDGSHSQCRLTIAGDTQAYRRINQGFRRGKTARITIEDAGVMKMDSTARLTSLQRRL